ncbi:MAG TPA: flagellar motor switch protein FliN [Solirubrobacteraceae bacterium]|jgi:flagellar motor switch protein FliN/FliY
MNETENNEHEHNHEHEHTPAAAGEQFDVQEQFAAPESESDGASYGGSSAGGPQDADLRRVAEVPLELSVEIGRTRMTVGETLDLRAGSIVTLDRLAGEPVDLLVNGTPIARGEVVVVDEQFGLRVTAILEGDGELPAAERAPAEQEGIASEAPA